MKTLDKKTEVERLRFTRCMKIKIYTKNQLQWLYNGRIYYTLGIVLVALCINILTNGSPNAGRLLRRG